MYTKDDLIPLTAYVYTLITDHNNNLAIDLFLKNLKLRILSSLTDVLKNWEEHSRYVPISQVYVNITTEALLLGYALCKQNIVVFITSLQEM